MPKKSDIKFVGLIMLGVMAAGYAMHAMDSIAVVKDAKRGFGAT